MKGDLHPEKSHREKEDVSGRKRNEKYLESRLRQRESQRRWRGTFYALLVLLLTPVVFTLTGDVDLLAQQMFQQFAEVPSIIEAEDVKPIPVRESARPFTFKESDDHPDKRFHPYLGTSNEEFPNSSSAALIPKFRDLLDIYVVRQGQDDNFTVRMLDMRDGSTLEVYTLWDEKRAFEATGTADWPAIDKKRSAQTKRLVRKHEQLGVSRRNIGAKWGRRNQVFEARKAEQPFIEYEIRLARYLGLSLLATEIGTVETFNQDWMISRVGARGRYQMMPFNLRKSKLHRYKLQTAYGKQIWVYEERHPLLTMEPAFRLLRGYVNAVGHEIPGLSAYHTGPGNLYKVYQMYLTANADHLDIHTSVMDAFMWAVTDGYSTVSRKTNFKGYSRGYVPSGYGALRAVESMPIDTSLSIRTERVQLKTGETLYLSHLLKALGESGVSLDWGIGTASHGLYERFRRLNPHFRLPDGPEDGGIPGRGDVRLVSKSGSAAVRFFLPLQAAEVLAQAGIDVLDESASFRFDGDAYSPVAQGEKTRADVEYEALVRTIEQYGFTLEKRAQLKRLLTEFEELAEKTPTHYRLTQLEIIKTHHQLWNFAGWEKLAKSTRAAKGLLRLPVRPPYPLEPMTARAPVLQGEG